MPPTTSFSPLALVLIPLGYLFLWPLVDHLLKQSGAWESPLQSLLTALGLGAPALAFLMFVAGLLPGHWLNGITALILIALGWIAGLALNRSWFNPSGWRAHWVTIWDRLKRLDLQSILLWMLIGFTTVILVDTLYYPFNGEDELSRYAWDALRIYLARSFPETVTGYPPTIHLSFVLTWFAAGAVNEHLARLYAFVMSMGTLGAAYLVTRTICDRSTGLIAAVLIALTPHFVTFASLGYVDIPLAFLVLLMYYYILRWWKSGAHADALWAGLAAGAALFTKHAAVIFIAGLLFIPLLKLVTSRQQHSPWNLRRTFETLIILALPPLIVGVPWFLHSYLSAGPSGVFPVSGAWHRAGPHRRLMGLFPSLAWIELMGLFTGVVFAFGWAAGLLRSILEVRDLLRAKLFELPDELLMFCLVGPFWLAWWINFSFSAEYVLTLVPFMAICSAPLLAWVLNWFYSRIHWPRLTYQVVGTIFLMVLFIYGDRSRLGAVYYTLSQPFASDAEKLIRLKGAMYDIVLWIRDNLDPATNRLVLMDIHQRYYLYDFQHKAMYPQELSDLEGYDYLVHVSSLYGLYDARLGWDQTEFFQHAFDPLIFEPVYVSGGVHVMRILRTTIPTQQEYDAYYAAHPVEP